MLVVMGWMNKDVPEWLKQTDRFQTVSDNIKTSMGWL